MERETRKRMRTGKATISDADANREDGSKSNVTNDDKTEVILSMIKNSRRVRNEVYMVVAS